VLPSHPHLVPQPPTTFPGRMCTNLKSILFTNSEGEFDIRT
jgi:hypothetical protein